MGAPIAMQVVEVELLTPLQPSGISNIVDTTLIDSLGDPLDIREIISPREGPINWYPISLSTNGEPWGNNLPQFVKLGEAPMPPMKEVGE